MRCECGHHRAKHANGLFECRGLVTTGDSSRPCACRAYSTGKVADLFDLIHAAEADTGSAAAAKPPREGNRRRTP